MVLSLLLCALLLAFCHAQQKYYFGDCVASGVNNIENTGACMQTSTTPLYLKFERVNTASFLRPVGIDQYTLDNDQRLLTSVYYADGKPYNFQTIKYDGSSEQFSTINGLTEEVKITTVRNNVPRTRFQSGWAFTGTGKTGEVACIFPNGTNVLWVAMGNYGLMRGSLVADKFANSGWDGALMVATTFGYMFQIFEKSVNPQFRPIVQNANGSPRSFTSWCEGLDIFPVTAAWGNYAGCLIVGNEQIAQGFVACPPAAASPNTFPALVTHYTPIRIEDVDHIEADENFYGVNYAAGRLIGVAASQWKTVTSSLLMTAEFGGISGWHTGQMLLTLDQASGLFKWTRIWYATDSPIKDITHYEHVTFARAGILNIPPGAPLCFVILEITGGTRPTGAYAIPTPITSWYSYNSATRSSATLLSLTTAGRLYTFFTVDANNFISFVIAANPSQAGIIRVSVTGINVDFRGSVLTIQDDPDDKFSWDVSTGLGSFVWNMTGGQSDGVVLSPVVILGTGKGTCFRLSVDTPQASHKLTSWWSFWGNSVQKNETQIPSFTEKPKFCVYECSNTCFLFTNCGTCTAAAGCGWCDSLSTCLKTTDPAYTFCPVKYAGNGTCPCNLAVGCETCQAFSGCTWCCSPTGQQCAKIGDPNVICNATYSTIAQCSNAGGCSGSCGPGTCSCGVCVCPPDFSGPNCEFENGCDGVPNSGLVFDRCGICGGNGTTCLGCDGTVFGPKYDQCGICGGNGTTCFDLCPYDTCFLCTLDPENCHWCAPNGNAQNAKGSCSSKKDACAAGSSEVKECGAVTTIVLSGGAIAGIIIAALILAAIVLLCLIFGGGGGVAVGLFAAQRGKMSSVQNNPLFVDKAPANNPFYEN